MSRFIAGRDGGRTDEIGHYRFIANAFSGQVVGLSSLTVTPNSPLAMSVLVATGDVMIPTLSGGYAYTGWSDAVETVSIATANTSNPRRDYIIAYVDKSVVQNVTPNNPNALKFVSVAGTPAGSPSNPTLAQIQAVIGSTNPYVILASVLVPANATSINAGNITDTRIFLKVSAEKVDWSGMPKASVTRIGSFSFASGSNGTFLFDNILFDTHSAYNNSNGRYVAPVSGYYRVTVQMSIGSGYSGYFWTGIYKNGTEHTRGNRVSSNNTNGWYGMASRIVYLNAGEYVSGGYTAQSAVPGEPGNAICYMDIECIGRQ